MIKNWFALTNTEFDPIGFYLNPTLRTTICPSCDDCIEKSFFTSKKVNKSIKRVLNEEKGKEELIEVFEEQLDIGWSEEKTPTLFPSVSSTILHLQNSTNQQSASSSSKFASLDPSKRSHQSCRLSCTNCNWSGTKEELGIYKFLRDLQSALIFIIKSDRPLNHVLVKTITNYTRSTSRTNKTSTTDTTLKTNNSSNNQSHNNSSTTTANKNSNGSSSSYHTSNSSTNCDKRYETYREEEEVEADDREGEDLQDNLEFSELGH
ncbi:hypothetical protein BY996DRAFT_1924401 [Phakopsora pachyrhizi]|nr:hypothetical protein BY996DRAFT_1924401 [Phakopsora pachyrhizi]